MNEFINPLAIGLLLLFKKYILLDRIPYYTVSSYSVNFANISDTSLNFLLHQNYSASSQQKQQRIPHKILPLFGLLSPIFMTFNY